MSLVRELDFSRVMLKDINKYLKIKKVKNIIEFL